LSCETDCAALTPSVNVIFDDVWTDTAAAGHPKDSPIALRYSDLVTPAPASAGCQQQWTPVCRTVIHYPTHIQPLWDATRVVLAADGVTVQADHTCVSCHSTQNAAGQTQVPAGQLDLTGQPSTDEPDHFTSYRELLFTDNEQEINMGQLQDSLQPATVAPSMVAGSATDSVRFFARFNAGNIHEGYLSNAEMRLISEWLDIGAQYYNDPFAVPQN
jgi:hypothetical protein